MTPANDLQSVLEAARTRFVDRNPESRKIHEEALLRLPGGNTRTLLHTVPYPVAMKSGSSYKVIDEDGHE